MTALPGAILLIPVYNEAENILPLLEEVDRWLPGWPVCFIDDASTDATRRVLRSAGCCHLTLPCNLGVGGAMQAGFRYAFENGYEYALRIDGDGQHAPEECGRLIDRMVRGDVDMVLGSRFLGQTDGYTSAWYRQAGIAGLALALSLACRQRITDPTSGFQIVNRAVMYYFAQHYPADYPEPEALALLSRQGYRFCEVATAFRPRRHGVSTIQAWGTLYYLFKVGVALFVDRCRAVDPRYDRANVGGLL